MRTARLASAHALSLSSSLPRRARRSVAVAVAAAASTATSAIVAARCAVVACVTAVAAASDAPTRRRALYVDAAGRSSSTVMAAAAAPKHEVEVRDDVVVVEPGVPATAAIIFMHGLGDTAHGWLDVATDVFGPALPHARIVLPTAHTKPVTINGGMPMPSWYDIESLSGDRSRERCAGIDDSRKRVHALIGQQLKAGIAESRIVLAGFSQGGAMSVFVGLDYPRRLGECAA